MTPDASTDWPVPEPYDFVETTRLLRTGGRDPTVRRRDDGFWRTTHTLEGPATARISVGERVHADVWGPGAKRALEDIPHWLGLREDPWTLPSHPVTDALMRRHRGLRLNDTRNVFEGLLVVVLQQLVTWREAAAAWRRLCEGLGSPAPGPHGMRLPPTPAAVRGAGTDRLQSFGMLAKQARTLMEVARVAHVLPRVPDLPTPEADALLRKIRGVGRWSSALLLGSRLARPEPVPVGDFHLPNVVAWALAGEPRGSDARMVELLRPFDGCAFRVVRLLSAARIEAPRRGPKRAVRRRW